MPVTPPTDEDRLSQLPALKLLQALGYTYLTPEAALLLRGGRLSEVLLVGVLEERLPKINAIRYKGEEHVFSGGNIASAIEALRDVMFDGLIRTNEKIYDLLMLGKSLQQSVLGDLKSFTLQYIDWVNPANNVYHVTEEFSVERTGSRETRRPDLILFANGIPLCVIECKSPKVKNPIKQAISQHIRNQKDDEIPKLFLYAQLLLSTAVNAAQYGTVGTPYKFWARWREQAIDEKMLGGLVNQPMTPAQKNKVFESRAEYVREEYDQYGEDSRGVTEQDRAIFALCRPERLLELSRRYVIFDKGEKKIARYQQFFTVHNMLSRIRERDDSGARRGGVVWHTQGSGKSLTMVMLAKNLALEPGLHDQRIILVTDRVDLDEQIWGTFHHCGLEPQRARTGAHLAGMLEARKDRVMTTVINKFEALASVKDARFSDENIFVLVDESHRGQYGTIHAKMRKVLPLACYIGFTGTPVMKKDKNTVERFGGLIEPIYTIRDAVDDKAVVPLLYEGRYVPLDVDEASIDRWFDKITENLSKSQTADLKKKFATSDHVNRAEDRIMAVAWDISTHFRDNWKGTGFKAQLVAPWKHIALSYKKYLDEFGMVTSEVLFSGPDEREGHTSTSEFDEDQKGDNRRRVNLFWRDMMSRYETEEEYSRQLINSFKHDDEPEIIIVCHKLLTGFDAPRNTVLYLDRELKEHTLLQAIARVNRLHEGKKFGYVIDYRGVLANLGRALELYDSLPDFDHEDLEGTLTDVSAEIARLPQRHSDLWDVFKEIRNKYDEEAYERLLADEALRARFYERFRQFHGTLKIALGNVRFIEETPEERIESYKRDAKFFRALRTSVQRRYAEVVDMSDYEARIERLIDKHVGAGEVEQITALVNIFDRGEFESEIARVEGDAAMADTIASRTKKTLEERMEEDPAFYKRFSELLEEVIDEFRRKRIQAAEYLKRVREIMENVVNRTGDEVPDELKNTDAARAFYGVISEVLERHNGSAKELSRLGAKIALGIDKVMRDRRIVNWVNNSDVQNQMRTGIEDFLFDLKDQEGLEIGFEDMDEIMERCIDIAKHRYAS